MTWLEATIACPIFTGLIVYMEEQGYNPDKTKRNRHLMATLFSKPKNTELLELGLWLFD